MEVRGAPKTTPLRVFWAFGPTSGAPRGSPALPCQYQPAASKHSKKPADLLQVDQAVPVMTEGKVLRAALSHGPRGFSGLEVPDSRFARLKLDQTKT